MKKAILLPMLLFILGANAQGDLTTLLETTHTSIDVKIHVADRLDAFVLSVAASHKQETPRLRKIFNGLHKSFLKKYEAYSDFDEIFSKGQYDCLTATALFSNVLDRFHYSYKIIETNYHIFLIVKTSEGEVMIETTDRLGGFITRPAAIRQRIQEYKKNIPVNNHSNGIIYQYAFSLYQEISGENLSGLLYFNQAVKAYNRHDWMSCSILLEKANLLYSSPRCEALGSLLIQTISESSLGQKEKADCLVRLKIFLLRKSDLASN